MIRFWAFAFLILLSATSFAQSLGQTGCDQAMIHEAQVISNKVNDGVRQGYWSIIDVNRAALQMAKVKLCAGQISVRTACDDMVSLSAQIAKDVQGPHFVNIRSSREMLDAVSEKNQIALFCKDDKK